MSDVAELSQRIEAEFAAAGEKVKKYQAQQVEEFHGREQRLKQFDALCGELRDIWGPRLNALADRFGKEVTVAPSISPTRREATFSFQSKLARIVLKFSVSTDRDVRKLHLDYDLEVVPILMKFDAHQHVEYPLESVDRAAVARWIDDRIVSFVRTYLSLHENEYYLKDHMVEDPVAHIRFPRFAAAATVERQGKTYYFIGEETRREFESRGP
jgi:YHS domain-containing protein